MTFELACRLASIRAFPYTFVVADTCSSASATLLPPGAQQHPATNGGCGVAKHAGNASRLEDLGSSPDALVTAAIMSEFHLAGLSL